MTWYKVADHINELDFADNNIAVTELKGKKICIARYQESVFAFAYKCPHAGGILAEGYYLKHWPVENREEGVYVGMQESSGFFGWLK